MRAAGYLLAAIIPAGLLLAAFVYGYPHLFPAIERDHVDNYRERVIDLIDQEEYGRAVAYAELAAERRPHDPEAWATLAIARHLAADTGGAADAAEHAVSIRQTMDGVPTRRPAYHATARTRLARYAQLSEDWAAAVGHLELGRRAVDFDPGVFALAYQRLDLLARAAQLRGELPDSTDHPDEWVELETIRQYRPWEPCQLHRVRLGLHEDGRVDLEWVWARDGAPLSPVSLSTRMNEVPMEVLAALDSGVDLEEPGQLPLVIPGWQTTEHLWHEGSRLSLEHGETPAIVVSREGEPGNAMINTLPVRANGAMLVAVRVRAEGGPASITWLAEDARERESFRDTFEPVAPGEWTWRVAYHPASHHWDSTWLQIGLFDAAGRVEIERVIMLPLPGAASPCAQTGENPLADS